MEALVFDVVLKSVPVTLKGAAGETQEFLLRELNGTQRAAYNESFDIKIEMVDGKATPAAGENFKTWSAKKFVAMCLVTKEGKAVLEEDIGKYPGRVVGKLHVAALELSGLDEKSLKAAKND